MVLPGRIELPTSALPRMRSTTELRQQTIFWRTERLCVLRGKRAYGLCWTLLSSAGLANGPSITTCRDRPNPIIKARMSNDEDRKRRLAQALRENLRKRKGQARENGTMPAPKDEPKDGL